MVAMLAFGGTFAYFTATANKQSATVTTGVIKLTSGTATNATITGAVTGTPILGAVKYDATGTTADSYVFVKLTSTTSTGVKWEDLFGTALAVDSAWTEYTAGNTENTKVYYATVTAEGAGEMPFLTELKITASPKWVEGQPQPKEMGANASISVEAEAIQKNYLTGANETEQLATAYAALFKTV